MPMYLSYGSMTLADIFVTSLPHWGWTSNYEQIIVTVQRSTWAPYIWGVRLIKTQNLKISCAKLLKVCCCSFDLAACTVQFTVALQLDFKPLGGRETPHIKKCLDTKMFTNDTHSVTSAEMHEYQGGLLHMELRGCVCSCLSCLAHW